MYSLNQITPDKLGMISFMCAILFTNVDWATYRNLSKIRLLVSVETVGVVLLDVN